MFLRNITGEQYRGHVGSLLLSLTGKKEDTPLHYCISALVDRLVAVADNDVLDDMNLATPSTKNALIQHLTRTQATVRFQQDEEPATPTAPPKQPHIQGFVNRLTGYR